MHGDVRQESQT